MKKKHSRDDIGFDEQGKPFAIGDAAAAAEAAIVEHPDAKPVLLVATLNNEIGIRVFGPPDAETADVLDHIAATYRKALDASRGPRQ
jgi:hypothetical protein